MPPAGFRPAPTPRSSGDRIKTDARDALLLARLLRLGELTAVTVPSLAQEVARDLVRVREDVRADLMRSRQRTSKLLQGILNWDAASCTYLASGRRTGLATVAPRLPVMDQRLLDATLEACRLLIRDRFPGDDDNGAAAMLLDDGSILTGTAPAVLNPSVEVCHELEPFCGAYRLGLQITAPVCLHRQAGGRTVVLSPCGVCRERLAVCRLPG